MKGPSFSVVIPTYNRAKLVQRTLRTVFDQRYPAYEIIVIDNCSTDETEDVLRPLAEEGRVIFVRHERNLERAASRNTGLVRASGDFVTFLDSDDLMYRENLSDAAAFVRQHPDAQLFHNLYEHVTPDGRVLRRGRYPSIRDPVRAIAGGNFMSCIGNFIRRDLYRELRFDDDLVGSEDWVFWMRAIGRAGLGRIARFNSALVNHEERSVLQFDLDSAAARLNRLMDKVTTDPELSHTYAAHVDDVRASCYFFLASAANSAGRQRAAIDFLAEAIRAQPASIKRRAFPRIALRAASGSILAALRT